MLAQRLEEHVQSIPVRVNGRARIVNGCSLVLALAVALSASVASAECCRLVKVDDATPASQLRACEPDADGECGGLVFAGTLAVGESQTICASTDRIVYEEYDEALGGFQPPVEAVCDGGDVEL